MYILIKIGNNGLKTPELVSKRKYKLEKYLKNEGYYKSRKLKRYIKDKTVKISGGSGTDFIINKIKEIN